MLLFARIGSNSCGYCTAMLPTILYIGLVVNRRAVVLSDLSAEVPSSVMVNAF